MTRKVETGYAPVNGLEMYYEVHGEGEPLVLLHGGFTSIETSFGGLLPSFAEDRQVMAVEQQGHGHTADLDRPMTFEQMADDTADLLRYLEVERADFFGYSDGGNVALGVGIRHPELVRKLAVAGVNYNRDGLYPGFLEFLRNANPDELGGLKDAYASVAPDPDGWPSLVAKVCDLTLDFEGWRPEDLQGIGAPTLVMVGDDDVIRPEHTIELFRLLPDSRLAVLPGTDHVSLLGRVGWLRSMIGEFLDAPMPKKGESE